MPSFLQPAIGMPWWVTLAVLVPIVLYGLMFLAMPFVVFGLKGRMESVEARLDEIQEDVRHLAIRLQEAASVGRTGLSPHATEAPPPIAPLKVQEEPHLPRLMSIQTPRRQQGGRSARSEPRLDWPR